MSGATIGTMLLAIGTGAKVGDVLVNYSGLSSATFAEHLMAGKRVRYFPVAGITKIARFIGGNTTI